MDRRSFTKTALTAAVGASVLGTSTASAKAKLSEGGKAFNSKFAPNLDQFKASTEGFSLSDKLKFMYDQGFRALEDNGMKWRPIEEQNEIAKTMEQLGMEMGVFCSMIGYGNMGMTGFRMDRSSMNRDKQAVRDWIKKEMEGAIEVGKRVNAKWTTVVTCEEDDTLEPEYQMANVIECMKYAAEIAERTGLIMVMEPLNIKNHWGMWMKRVPQAYAVCKGVGSPTCKILDDLYHQQITEGNLIMNIDEAWDEIAYFQQGDVPGRNEPTTGEINYKNVFQHIWDKGYRGILGMEHGQSDRTKEGDAKLIAAYRAVDSNP